MSAIRRILDRMHASARRTTYRQPPQRFHLLGREYRLVSISGHAWSRYADPHGPITYTYHPEPASVDTGERAQTSEEA